MYSTLFCAAFSAFPHLPMPFCMVKQTTVHQILSENAILENVFSSHILTNENPFSFCLRKSFRCPPKNPLCFAFLPVWSIQQYKHTPFVIRSNSTTRFRILRFSYRTNFPAKQSSSNKNPPRIHNHLFSRKIQKQRSEQPSLCLGYDGESILGVLLKSERELRWKQFNAFSRPAIQMEIYKCVSCML